ncbi:hypothetical protein KC345_g55 [Hortaea werneckii]|nr:hypothetical protein KC345_g55 [Hortaea werneckii]
MDVRVAFQSEVVLLFVAVRSETQVSTDSTARSWANKNLLERGRGPTEKCMNADGLEGEEAGELELWKVEEDGILAVAVVELLLLPGREKLAGGGRAAAG